MFTVNCVRDPLCVAHVCVVVPETLVIWNVTLSITVRETVTATENVFCICCPSAKGPNPAEAVTEIWENAIPVERIRIATMASRRFISFPIKCCADVS